MSVGIMIFAASSMPRRTPRRMIRYVIAQAMATQIRTFHWMPPTAQKLSATPRNEPRKKPSGSSPHRVPNE
ncbi:hypothetical protein OHA21_28675 [Actinoplanes sp. NBC_00393]